MKAIKWTQEISGLVIVEYGESEFKRIDEFWVDFKGVDGSKGPIFAANVVKDTPANRQLVAEIQSNRAALKSAKDKYETEIYQILNKIER